MHIRSQTAGPGTTRAQRMPEPRSGSSAQREEWRGQSVTPEATCPCSAWAQPSASVYLWALTWDDLWPVALGEQ